MHERAKQEMRRLARRSRWVLALKTALAAALAWVLAPFVPFAESEYSYYAPLGALVSVYATVLDSVRAGVQVLIGLALGIALGLGALGLVHAGAPSYAAIAVVVGIGVALGGLKVLGAGGDWVPIAGVLVLLLSGREGEDFSVSYLVTMAFGAALGLVVQWVAVPPLYFAEADARLSDLRRAITEALRGTELFVRGEGDEGRFRPSVAHLHVARDAVAADLDEARRSGRANPRAHRHHAQRESLDERFASLDRCEFYVRALSDFVGRSAEGDRSREGLGDALEACRAVVDAKPGSDEQRAAREAAQYAVDRYVHLAAEAVTQAPAASGAVPSSAVAIGVCLRRILETQDADDA
ncbi:FUSC family protein [Leucobacter sp. gxy201]|uniref:FUSC family protein n=1 Tax=Leucobacter sp. gxy201 TaxID=2957200 RepID=UPI003DA1BF12